jgi:hypothetical protein
METSEQLAAAVRDFVARIDDLDPTAPVVADVSIRIGSSEISFSCREPVAAALVAALRDYYDPRDQGPCDHCGSRRMDDNFVCRDCGQANGVFGRMLAERAGRFVESPALDDGA